MIYNHAIISKYLVSIRIQLSKKGLIIMPQVYETTAWSVVTI